METKGKEKKLSELFDINTFSSILFWNKSQYYTIC